MIRVSTKMDKCNSNGTNNRTGTNVKCLVCNDIVEVTSKSQESDMEDDEDDSESYLRHKNQRRVRLLKNYLSLFCELINLNVDDSFGHLFTSTTTSGNSSAPNEILWSPSCCFRCFDLLINTWKLQKIIKQTQDLQQTDVKFLKQLLLDNPSHAIENHRRCGIESSEESLTSTTLPRCDDIDISSTLNKTRDAKLKAMESFKNLPSASEQIKTEKETNCDIDLPADEDYFDSEYLPSDNETIENDTKTNLNNSNETRFRLGNFSYEENQVLLQLVKENLHIIYGSMKTVNKPRRNAVYSKITAEVNQVGGWSRTVKQIKKKIGMLQKTADLANIETDAAATNQDLSSENITSLTQRQIVNGQFSHKEVQVLSNMLSEYITACASRQGNGDVLNKITNAVNEVGGMSRSKQQVNVKLKNLRIKMKKNLAKRQITSKRLGLTRAVDNGENVPCLDLNSEKVDQIHSVTPVDCNSIDLHQQPNEETFQLDVGDNHADKGELFRQFRNGLLKRRPRSNNFSPEETQLISKLFNENFNTLWPSGDYNPVSHKYKRDKTITHITNSFNEVGDSNRTTAQIWKKLYSLREEKLKVNSESADCATFRMKRRGANYADEEVELMTKLLLENRTQLYGIPTNKSTKHTKEEILMKITNAVNQLGGKPRSMKQICNKLGDIRQSLGVKPPKVAKKKKMAVADKGKGNKRKSDSVSKIKTKKVKKYVHRPRVKGSDIFQCSQCGRQFDFVENLRRHEVCHIPKALRPKLDCPKCDVKLLSKAALTIHLMRIHKVPANRPKSKITVLICHICDMKFGWYDGHKFRRHVSSHAGDNCPRPYMCDICGKDFLDKYSLEKHVQRVHATDRPYQCEFCVENYKHPNNLKRHRRSCHKDLISEQVPKHKPVIPFESTPEFIGPRIAYPCEFCEKVFPLRSRLTKHLVVCRVKKEME